MQTATEKRTTMAGALAIQDFVTRHERVKAEKEYADAARRLRDRRIPDAPDNFDLNLLQSDIDDVRKAKARMTAAWDAESRMRTLVEAHAAEVEETAWSWQDAIAAADARRAKAGR